MTNLPPALAMWAIFLTLLAAPAAHADHGGATFEHECVTREGNPDGTWCLWTNPDNGLRYLVTSNIYRQDAPFWEHP